jgi:flagellar protein FlgJ
MQLSPIGSPSPAAKPDAAPPAEAAAKQAAEKFEAAFLAEMLKYTGLNATSKTFGGGAGEEAFASLLTDEYARLLAERGGVGLAEQVFELLKQRIASP